MNVDSVMLTDAKIPIGSLRDRIEASDINANYVVFCKCGLKNVKNLQGGIDAWAVGVDSSMARKPD